MLLVSSQVRTLGTTPLQRINLLTSVSNGQWRQGPRNFIQLEEIVVFFPKAIMRSEPQRRNFGLLGVNFIFWIVIKGGHKILGHIR